jgi:tRNA dimethylallyltransferase
MTDALAPLVVIVGPTAVGKTQIAIDVARHVRGEIICADSRTQYRGMDIGTAKPSAAERTLIPHHLLDVIAPNETFTLAQFQSAAYAALSDITARKLIPLVVGGSGLYVKCIIEGFRIPEIEPDEDLRTALDLQARQLGPASLHNELARVDPVAAQRIGASNTRRLIRALEVYRTLGVPISQLQQKVPPPYRILTIGLTRAPESLQARIEHRVDAMLAGGLIEEVQTLVAAGYGYDLPAMSGIGYREVGAYLRGEIDLATARALIVQNTRRFVRRQYQWFRRTDPSINWVDLDAPAAMPHVRRLAGLFIESGYPLHAAAG